MNLKMAQRLADLLREGQAAIPLHWDEKEDGPHGPRGAAWASVSYENSDLRIHMFAPGDVLAKYPADLYIDEDGVLYEWDPDKPVGEEKTPCTVKWRYGTGDQPGDRRHLRYLDVVPAG